MPWMNGPATSETVISRIGWFLHHVARDRVDQVHARTALSTATIRRYMDYAPHRIAAGGGPQRLPILLRILTALDVNPARLIAALHYAHDAQTFWRLIHSKLCIEHSISFQVGIAEPLEVERKVIPLEDTGSFAVQAAGGHPIKVIRASVDRIQAKLASFLDEQLRGQIATIHSATGIAKTTLRRYSDPTGSAHGGAGPQSIRALYDILGALEVNPAKLFVACYYSSDDYSFRLLMNASLCIEETLQFSVPGAGHRIDRRLHNLDVPAASGDEDGQAA